VGKLSDQEILGQGRLRIKTTTHFYFLAQGHVRSEAAMWLSSYNILTLFVRSESFQNCETFFTLAEICRVGDSCATKCAKLRARREFSEHDQRNACCDFLDLAQVGRAYARIY